MGSFVRRQWSRRGYLAKQSIIYHFVGSHCVHIWGASKESFLILDESHRVPELFQTLGRLWTKLAHHQGTLLNAARLAAGLGGQFANRGNLYRPLGGLALGPRSFAFICGPAALSGLNCRAYPFSSQWNRCSRRCRLSAPACSSFIRACA